MVEKSPFISLFGDCPVQLSIDLLQMNEPREGYRLAFSGGKDSLCCDHLCKLAGVRYEKVYNVVTCDPPELVYYIREHHPDARWERSKNGKSIFTRIVEKGFPVRSRRWCCDEFKHGGGEGRFIITGIRDAESSARRARSWTEICKPKRKRMIHPIKHWGDEVVWWFIRHHNLPYCKLYDEGWKRLGCVVCPFEERKGESQRRWPGFWRLAENAIKARWECHAYCQELWPSADALWEWWKDGHKPYPKRGVQEDSLFSEMAD